MRTSIVAVAALLAAGLVAPGQAAAASTLYEAEQATVSSGTVDADHAGFTGTGFVNTANASGVSVEFTVNAPAATSATLGLRYAATANRPATVTRNATAVGTAAFPATPAWEAWATARLPVSLTAGVNRIRVTATTAAGLPNLDSLSVAGLADTDWSNAVVDSTMRRFTPATIGGWDYPIALYLMGQYKVAQRTTDPVRRAALIAYIRVWADRFVDAGGHVNNAFNSLDSMMPGQVMIALYRETGLAKYRLAAKQIHDRLVPGGGYPTTSDGGFWHNTGLTNQLWSDGVFMADPFMAQYGSYVGDATQSYDIATKQLVVYASHLQQPNGLMKHAYLGSSGVSAEHWCRAVGWFGLAAIEILDLIPAGHPRRAQLVAIVQNLVRGFATYQDPATGRWFQVVDKGANADNWTETSCSAMYTFTIDAAIARGYVASSYRANVDAGVRGELGRISLHTDGLTYLTDVVVGTGVGNYAYYVGRPRSTNDFHGLGAFLYFSEETAG